MIFSENFVPFVKRNRSSFHECYINVVAVMLRDAEWVVRSSNSSFSFVFFFIVIEKKCN